MNLSADLEATDAGAGIEVATSTLQVTGGNRRVDTNVGAIMLDEIADDGSNRTLTLDAGGTGAAADITIDDNVASNGSELGTLAIEEADEVLFSGAAATVDVQALTIGTPAVNGVTFDGVVRADGGPGASGISANAGATINANFTTGGQLDIDTDTNMDAVGDLTLAGGVTVSTGGNPLNLTVADFVFGGGAGTNSGGADTTVTASSNNDIGLGATALGGSALEITNAEIAALSTSGTLVIQNKTGSGNLIAVDDVDAGATDLQLISEGTINDTDDVGVNLETTGTLTLTSAGEIGNTVTGAEGLNIDASAVNITATGGNNVTLTDTTTGSTDTDYDIGSAAATGDVTITHTADNDDIIVVGIDATGGTVTLDAQDSGIQDDTSSATASITASSVILDAGDGIGDVDALELSQVATLNVEAAKNNTGGIDIDNASTAGVTVQLLTTGSGNGDIFYDQTGANTLGLTMVDSADGAINVTAAGTVTATSVVSSTTNADANDITIETSAGDIDVTLVDAGTTDGDVFLSSAAGAVNGPGTNGTPDVSGEDIEIVASTGIGAGTLDIDGVRLAATTATGNIDIIDNAGGLTIDLLNVDGAGASTDGVSITGAGGFIILRTSSPMTVLNDITTASAGDVTLAALGAAIGDSLDIQGDVSSQGGGVNLYAGGSIDIAAGNTVSTTGAGAILVSAGTDFTGDAAANGNAAGNVDMGDGAFVNSDSGTITVRAPEGVALSIVDADADAAGAAGNVVVDADFDGPDTGLSNASGSITDSTTGDGTPNVTGNDVTLIGPSGIGGSTATSDIDVAVGGLLDADSSGMNADLNVQAGENGNVGPALVLDAITAGGGEVTIGARFLGAVTQNGGGSIIGTGLELRGAGDFTLTSTTNAIDTLVGDFTGTLSFLDSDGYNIDNAGAIGTLGLNSNGNNITLDTNTAGAIIDQANSSPIQASGLELLNGTFELTSNSDNDITTLAASTTFDFVYREGSTSTGFDVGNVGGTVGITTTGEVQLNAQAGTVTQSDIITADDLELRGGGSFLLDDVNNNIANFFAVRTGAGDVSFTNVGAIDVNSVGGTDGITRTGGDVQLTAGGTDTVTINQAIALGGGDLGIDSSGAVTQAAGQNISGGGLLLQGAGPFTLQNGGNAFTNLAANTTGTIAYRDTNTLNIGTVDVLSTIENGVTTGSNNFTLQTGGTLTISEAVTLGATGNFLMGDTVGIGGDVNGAGAAISGNFLQMTSTGAVTLSNANNDFARVAISAPNGVNYRDMDVVNVNAVNGTVGVSTTGGDVTLTAGTLISVQRDIDASGGDVTLNAMGGNVTTAGIRTVSGSVLDVEATGNIDINTTVTTADLTTTTAAATITVDETNGITYRTVNTDDGTATLTSNGLTRLGTLNTGAATLLVDAGVGAIASSTSDVRSGLLDLTAGGAIGTSAAPINTTTGAGGFDLSAGGGVFISENDAFSTNEINTLDFTGTARFNASEAINYNGDVAGFLGSGDTIELNGVGSTTWRTNIAGLGNNETIVFFDQVDLVGSRTAGSDGTVDFRGGIVGGAGESVTFNVDKVELAGGVRLAGATTLANAPILTFNSAVDVNDSQIWRIDRLRSNGSQFSAATDQVELTIALATRDDSRVVTIGGASDELMRPLVVDSFSPFQGEVAIGADIGANSFTATNDALPGEIVVDDVWKVSNSPGTITLVSLGDIIFANDSRLIADTINLIALGANPDSLGGLVIDQNSAIASSPGFVVTKDLVVVAAGSFGSDSGALGGGLTGTATGIINVASGSDKSFFDNFGNGGFGDGNIALGISDAFNLKLQELGFATTDLSSGLNVSGLQTGGLEVDAEVGEGVSESLFLLTSIIDATNGLLLPPQMNPSLPERPDDPGVENPDPDDPEQMAIDEEWQVFYNEDLIEFLVSEGYVLADDEGEVLPEEQALLEQYLDELIALYENIRAQERLILAAELSEFEDEEGLFDDGEEGFEDEDLEFEDDSDLLEDELDIDLDLDLDEEGAGLSDDIVPSAAIAAQTPVNLARLGHAGDSWSDGGLGVDGTWYSRLGEAWARAFD